MASYMAETTMVDSERTAGFALGGGTAIIGRRLSGSLPIFSIVAGLYQFLNTKTMHRCAEKNGYERIVAFGTVVLQ